MNTRCSTWNIHSLPWSKPEMPHLERPGASGLDPKASAWGTPGGTRQ